MSLVIKLFPAFRGRNFRLNFVGQIVSFMGTWLQSLALGWLVFQMTGSAYWVGLVSALMLLPGAVFAPFGGIVVDRFDRRQVLYVTQIAGMIQAIVLGALTIAGYITVPMIVVLACILSIINAVDAPARNAFLRELVEKRDLQSAAAMNGMMIQASQAVGPGLAGFMILWFGAGWTFIANGISFLAVVVALAMMRLEKSKLQRSEHPFRMVASGFRYTFGKTHIRLLVILVGVIGMLGFSYRGIMPVATEVVFKAGPEVLGYLISSVGLGALVAGVIVSACSHKLPFSLFVIGGSLLTGVCIIVFAMTTSLPIALCLLFGAGFGFMASFSTLRAVIQHIIDDHMMGRVMGYVIMIFFAGMACGNFLIGLIAQKYGCQTAFVASGIALLVTGAATFVCGRKLQEHVHSEAVAALR